MAYASVIGPIALKVRAAAEDLAGRAWGYQAPKWAAGAPTLPYAVVIPVVERPAYRSTAYRSRARHLTHEHVQVSLFAADAERAGVLFDAVDGALTFAPLELAGTAATVRVYLTALKRLIEPATTTDGDDIHHWACTYSVIVERDTPNK